jgi:hypothetical protein
MTEFGVGGDVEIVLTLVDEDVPRAMRTFGLDALAARRAEISFVEQRPVRFPLHVAGIVVQLRRDLTMVTLEPCRPDRFPQPWRASWTTIGHSYDIHTVLTQDRQMSTAALIHTGTGAGISARQRAFLDACGPLRVDTERLTILGPVLAQRWRFRRTDLDVAAERWHVPGRTDVLELSVRSVPVQALLLRYALLALAHRAGLDPTCDLRRPTAIVLDQLARS